MQGLPTQIILHDLRLNSALWVRCLTMSFIFLKPGLGVNREAQPCPPAGARSATRLKLSAEINTLSLNPPPEGRSCTVHH